MGHGHHHGPEAHHHPHQVVSSRPWEPRTKLIAGAVFVFGILSLNNLWLLAAALVFSAVFALWGGLTPGQLLKRLSVLVPFLALMSLPLIFGAGFPPAADRVAFAALISLKALTAMTFTLFVFTNQPIEEMLEAMEHLKVPSAITTVIYLAYRYGFLFIQEMQTTLGALRSRLFTGRINRYSLQVYGELAGGLFIKALHRSETVYRAMTSRGFQGSMPIDSPRKIRAADLFKASLPVGFLALLILIEQGVFK